jgi:glycosyltransferase involved in cell wall biosynthesis
MGQSTTPPPLRIAWLIAGNEGYGVRQAVLNLAQEVRALGCDVRVLTLDRGAFEAECTKLGFRVERLDAGPSPVLGAGLMGKVRGLARLAVYQRRAAAAVTGALARDPADAIHFLWPSFVVMAGRAARHHRIPAFWEMPNTVGSGYPFDLNRRVYQRLCARYGVQPLANSRHTAASLGEERVRPIIFYLGADAGRFDPQRVTPAAREEIGVPDGAVMITIAARLDALKGQLRALRAILAIPELTSDDLHLVLLGGPTDGALAGELREAARRAGAENRLHLMGTVPDPERYFAASDLVINSRIDPEPFGLTVVEAMMMGRPLLVHALGGPAETVLDGATGWHVHAPTEEAFAAGLQRALRDRAKWPEMGAAARAHALANFSTRVVAERYLEIVRANLAARSGPPRQERTGSRQGAAAT